MSLMHENTVQEGAHTLSLPSRGLSIPTLLPRSSPMLKTDSQPPGSRTGVSLPLLPRKLRSQKVLPAVPAHWESLPSALLNS